jgi:phosphomethylpyrimidine synthase
MTQLEAARKGILTPEMIRVAVRENITAELIREQVATGRTIIPANKRHLAGAGGQATATERRSDEATKGGTKARRHEGTEARRHEGTEGRGDAGTERNPASAGSSIRHSPFVIRHSAQAAGHPGFTPDGALWVNQTVAQRRKMLDDREYCRGERAPKRLDPIGIGRAITTKINANLGASPVSSGTQGELEKLRVAVLYGADTVMDLSTGGNLDECRQAFIDNSVVPVGTVPIYSMIIGRNVEDLTYDEILKEIEHQAQQGVDFFTIHAGILREHLGLIGRRISGLVSRGGSLLAKWMIHHNKQNPMYDLFDEISAIMREYDAAYSLGDGCRPGCLGDASDPAQIAELHVLGELTQRAREAGVQVMVEGPGHIPLNEVAWNMETERAVCDDAPFYVLGPIVTDVFPGYDHITSAIGACEAARAGAAMLCYVTPKEHVGLPRLEDVKQGCIAYKIAAHAGDIARGIRGARQWDDDVSKARAALNWSKHFELAFDGETARALHDEDLDVDTDFCAMCGHDWCAIRISKEIGEFASGKHGGYQPQRAATKSPALTEDQRKLLAERAGRASLPASHSGKPPCHSDNVPDAEQAKQVQAAYAKLNKSS